MALNYYIVCYIDILGFKSMVKYDCEHPNETKYFDLVRECFFSIKNKYMNNIDIKQFSDSIIISLPCTEENFIKTIDSARFIQKELFLKKILSRGGISYGKHYSESDFIFSEGLINAYKIEQENAKNPRIIISKELFNLFLVKDKLITDGYILNEDDGEYFIHYINLISLYDCNTVIDGLFREDNIFDYSIREKKRWIYEYANHYFNHQLELQLSRFA